MPQSSLTCTMKSKMVVRFSAEAVAESGSTVFFTYKTFVCRPKVGLIPVDEDEIELLEMSLNRHELDRLDWLFERDEYYATYASNDNIEYYLNYKDAFCASKCTNIKFIYYHHRKFIYLPSAITYDKSIFATFFIDYAVLDHAKRHLRPVTDIYTSRDQRTELK